MPAPKATIDFETRSACNLKKSGSWRYSLDASTEVLCMAWRMPYWDEGRTALWHPSFPALKLDESDNDAELFELFDWIAEGGLVEAHNAFFERGIWQNIMTPQFGWPPIASQQWRCSAAKAAAHSLPRSLDDGLKALRLPISKDAVGAKVMMKVSKPRKPRKAEREAYQLVGVPVPVLWWEDRDLFGRLWAYCRQDVLAEEALSAALPDLNVQETQVYLLDQAINERGFALDSGAVHAALRLVAKETVRLNSELDTLTGGQVKKATQRAKMLDWFESQGLNLEDTQKDTLDEVAGRTDLTPAARRGVEIVRTLGRSSTAKYQAMRDWLCPDGRVHGGLLYHGASTGRWSGKGVQPQNFPKGAAKTDQDALWATLKGPEGGSLPNVMEALSNGLRGTIIAPSGKTLYVADYASIEARVVMWLAGDEDALDMFRSGADIYREMASEIYDIERTKVDSAQRQVGKFAILGLGFQMGAAKFQATCEKFGVSIEDDFAQRVVDAYRAKFWRVKEMWSEQEAAAIRGCQTRTLCGLSEWYKEGRFLYCVLPSGRRLSYPDPQIRARQTPWGATKASLTFMGVNAYSRKWVRQTTYGGSLVENLVQAIARDLMAEAMLRVEASGIYTPVLTVHDEIVAEGPTGGGAGDWAGRLQEFEKLVTTLPTWASGLPIGAEGWSGKRYHK